jgi:hypothetical protein
MEIADDPQLMRIAVAAGDEQHAEHIIAQAERRCELNPGVVSFKAAAAHARGLSQGSAHDLQTAAALFATGPRPLATASALEDLGRLQASAGATADAISSFDRALAMPREAKPIAKSRRRCSYRRTRSTPTCAISSTSSASIPGST